MSKSTHYAICYCTVLILVLAHLASAGSKSRQLCNGATNDMSDTCGQISKDLETALLQDQGNLFRMRRAFFHSPTAAPVLLRVVYNISYSENLTQRAAGHGQGEEILLNYCVIITNDGEKLVANSENSVLSSNGTSTFTFGWTSSGIYTVFHPSVLNVVQVQTAFSILRAFHWVLQHNYYSPEADAFFWTGGDPLPTLFLDLHIKELSCIPSCAILESVLEDLNTLLMVFGGQQDRHTFEPSIEEIGFTLPSYMISVEGMAEGTTDLTLSVLYPLVMCIMYIILLQSTVRYYYPKHKEQIDQLMKNNAELVTGVATMSIFINAIEIPVRICNTLIWTVFAANSALSVVVTIWLPQFFIFGIVVFTNIYYHVKFIVQRPREKEEIGRNRDVNSCIARYYDRILYLFIPNIPLHVILVTFLFIFFFLYGIFPGFLLLFAYPTQVFAILSLVVAFLFAMTIFSAIMIKTYKRIVAKPRLLQRKRTVKFILLRFIPFLIGMSFLQVIAFLLLYSLIIGRGPVVGSQPLFFLTLLPSALLSGVTWMAKKTLVDEKKRPLDKVESFELRANASDEMTPPSAVEMSLS